MNDLRSMLTTVWPVVDRHDLSLFVTALTLAVYGRNEYADYELTDLAARCLTRQPAKAHA